MVKINPKLFIDIVYPVGSYYETSNTSFDPNTAWGGTWVEDTYGRVTVAYQSDNTPFNQVGKVGGEQTHTLTINEMPSHSHGLNWPGTSGGSTVQFSATISDVYSELRTKDTGGGQAHNNLQPYIVVKRWHRTA